MTWGAIGGAAVGVVGGAIANRSGGGGGGESSTTPYFAAAPGLVTNANYANGMQGSYMTEPFNAQQRTALNNIYGQSDYVRDLVPGLLRQLQSQPLAYDPANPSAKPRSWDWTGLMQSSADSANQGLSMLMGGQNNSMARAQQESDARTAAAAQAQAAAKPAQSTSQAFRQAQQPWNSVVAPSGLRALGGGLAPELAQDAGGGYGGFTYGMNVRDIAADPRLEADARQYFAMGGEDPYDVYGGQYLAADRRRAIQDQNAADRLWNMP